MKALKNIEAVGWVFFLVVFAVSAVPMGWGTWQITNAQAPALERAGLGVVFAALFAAVVAWCVNEILYRRNLHQHEAERKAAHAGKKNKKKRH